MRRVFSFIYGAVLGGLVGASVALLLAPASGDDLRSQMQARAESLQSEMMQAAQAKRAELEKQLAELRAPRRG